MANINLGIVGVLQAIRSELFLLYHLNIMIQDSLASVRLFRYKVCIL